MRAEYVKFLAFASGYVGIPRTLFEGEPPAHLCALGVGSAFEKSLGLSEGFTSEAANIFNVRTLYEVYQELVTPRTINDLLLGVVHSSITSTFGSRKRRLSSVAQETIANVSDAADLRQALQAISHRVSQMDPSHQWDPHGILGSNAMGFDTVKGLQALAKAEPIFMAEAADVNDTGINEDFEKDTTSRLSNVVDKLIGGLNFLGGQFNSDFKTDREIFSSFVRSAMVKTVVNGLFDYPEVRGLSAALTSPMLNLGTLLCEAADEVSIQASEDARVYSCATLTLIGQFLGCAEGEMPSCTSANKPSVPMATCKLGALIDPEDPADDALVIDTQLRPLPETASLKDVQKEGRLSYWLLRSVFAASSWANEQSPCSMNNPKPSSILPGYKIIEDLRLNQPGSNAQMASNATSISSGFLLRGKDKCQHVVVLRGTATDYEWMKDFYTALNPLPHDGSVRVHAGMLHLLAPLLPVLVDRLTDEWAHCTTTKPHLMVTGHSLGGGMANIAALALAISFKNMADINLIAFAPARSLDLAAASLLDELVNVRTWVAELDAVPNLPCANQQGFPRCDSRSSYGNFGEGRDRYAEHVNAIEIPYEVLEYLNPEFARNTWGSVGVKLNPITLDLTQLQVPAPLQFTANHICAYACYLSANYCTDDLDSAWMCTECSFY